MNPGDVTEAKETELVMELRVGNALLGALDPEHELTREELDVRLWRLEQLLEHDYEVEDALELARAPHVDLELARRLTARLGCPPPLAARILL